MTQRVLTARIQPELMKALEKLSASTGDSIDDLVETAITMLIQDDRDYVAAVTQGLDDIEAGRTVSHEDAMRHFRRTIAEASLKRA